jgi:Tfp pilus assembly protein PilZ/CheY-like chemotaxis protein
MKRLLLGDDREELLTTLDLILKHWGYRVLAAHSPDRLVRLIRDTSPELLIIKASWLSGTEGRTLLQPVRDCIARQAALLLLQAWDNPITPPSPHDTLDVPIDLFALFSVIQKHMEPYPRQNMRLNVKLPGMICRRKACHLGEILSLSSQGLFMKTGFRLEKDDRFKIVLPLMGMKEELEIHGRVLYCIRPEPTNNYQQGVGIEFVELTPTAHHMLEHYIKDYFLQELSDRHDQLFREHQGKESATGELVLRLPAVA